MRWCVVASVVVGCSKTPAVPDEAAARGAYESRKPKIAAFEAIAKRELDRLVPEPANTLERQVAATQQLQAAEAKLRKTFERALDDAGAVGGEIRFMREGDTPVIHTRIDIGPCRWGTNGGKNGRIQADDPNALSIDGRKIGWGLDQTATSDGSGSHGDDAYHPTIDVQWKVPGSLTLYLALCFMLDGTPRPT